MRERGDDPRADAGSGVVDQVEGLPACVEQPCEDHADHFWEPAEDPGQDQERTHDEVPEEHVEQKFLVGPPGAFCRAVQFRHGRVLEQLVKGLAGTFHLVAYRCLGGVAGLGAGHADPMCR
jgi:hypothetical protein